MKPIGHNRLYINSNKVFSVVLQNTPLVYLDVASHCYCQLHKSAAPHQIPDPLLSMQKCIDDIKTRMTVNKLKLNDDKTKEMITSSGRKSRSLSSSFPDSMSIGSASVPVNAVPLLALVTMFD